MFSAPTPVTAVAKTTGEQLGREPLFSPPVPAHATKEAKATAASGEVTNRIGHDYSVLPDFRAASAMTAVQQVKANIPPPATFSASTLQSTGSQAQPVAGSAATQPSPSSMYIPSSRTIAQESAATSQPATFSQLALLSSEGSGIPPNAPSIGFGAPFGSSAAAPAGISFGRSTQPDALKPTTRTAPETPAANGTGTHGMPFCPVSVKEGVTEPHVNYHSISCMPHFLDKSHEELRHADYSRPPWNSDTTGSAAGQAAIALSQPAGAPPSSSCSPLAQGAPQSTGSFGFGMFGSTPASAGFGTAPQPASSGPAFGGGSFFMQAADPGSHGQSSGSAAWPHGSQFAPSSGFGASTALASASNGTLPAFGGSPFDVHPSLSSNVLFGSNPSPFGSNPSPFGSNPGPFGSYYSFLGASEASTSSSFAFGAPAGRASRSSSTPFGNANPFIYSQPTCAVQPPQYLPSSGGFPSYTPTPPSFGAPSTFGVPVPDNLEVSQLRSQLQERDRVIALLTSHRGTSYPDTFSSTAREMEALRTRLREQETIIAALVARNQELERRQTGPQW